MLIKWSVSFFVRHWPKGKEVKRWTSMYTNNTIDHKLSYLSSSSQDQSLAVASYCRVHRYFGCQHHWPVTYFVLVCTTMPHPRLALPYSRSTPVTIHNPCSYSISTTHTYRTVHMYILVYISTVLKHVKPINIYIYILYICFIWIQIWCILYIALPVVCVSTPL